MRLHQGLITLLIVSSAACSKKAADSGDKPAAAPAKPADKPAEPPADKPADKPAAEAPKGGCSYITEAEATAALGQPSKYRSNDGSANCIIDPVADATQTTMSVDFTVKLGDDGAYTFLEKHGKPLAGVGDKAVMEVAGPMVSVAAVKGNATLSMTIMGPKAADPVVIKTFAEKVFSHL
jgi:hypothetical protein